MNHNNWPIKNNKLVVNECNQPHNNNSSFGKAFETHDVQHSLSEANCFHIIMAQVSSKKWR